jgi:polysaccharide biosynthesis protein PslH
VPNRTTPRILYLTPHCPHLATSASELRSLHIARALQALGRVNLVVVKEEDDLRQQDENPGTSEFEIAYSVPVHPHPARGVGGKLRWMLDPRLEYPHGCGVDADAMRQVCRTAQDFDLIWFFKLRTPNMFPRWAWPCSVADIDDVPSTYEQALLVGESGVRQRFLSFTRFLAWKRRDRVLGERFAVLAVCSEIDRRYLQTLGVNAPVHVIPNGSERPEMPPVRRLVKPPRIGFIGIFDYRPNVEGIQWFVSQCWPRIKRVVPDVRLRLVGRFSDGALKPAGPDIDGLGWVKDVADEMATWSAMIVPIHVGAGTRGKIVHAFSLKCPVVSTSLGAYGYDATDGQTMFLADSVEGFSDACVRTIHEPMAAEAVAERAWQQFLERWTWEAIRPRIWAAAEDCLRRSQVADHNTV